MMDCKKLISLSLLLIFGCTQPSTVVVTQGFALGTSYSIKVESQHWTAEAIEAKLDSLFYIANKSMSTYIPQSDISKINQGMTDVIVDEHFRAVFDKATEVWEATDGLFDPTVGSFVNAYGFGPEAGFANLSQAQIDSLLDFTGWQNLELTPKGNLIKKDLRTYLDFNALAKGYTIDMIGRYFESQQINNYLIEVGGELRAKGQNPTTQKTWRIAIDHPNQEQGRNLIRSLPLSNQSLATSGNYRKFRIDPRTGEKYVHSINPILGLPVQSSILSASVLAPDCMTADAWATALMVMPLEQGQQLIAQHSDLEAYWIVAKGDQLLEYFSVGWPKE